MRLPRSVLLATQLALPIALGSCNDPVRPTATTGVIRVTVTTTGTDVDADGYSVSVDGGAARAIATTGEVSFSSLDPGVHAVRLEGMASNCQVGGSNPRAVTVSAGETVSAAFAVTCSRRTGSIRVTTVTTGEGTDPSGYLVQVDTGGTGRAISANGVITIAGLTPGAHTVRLEEVSPTCQVEGSNPVSATVTAEDTTDVTFAVVCGPNPGSVRVITSTTGVDLDPNGYVVTLDDVSQQSVAVNDTLVLLEVTPGDHTVGLGQVTANCAVDGDNPRSITVASDATVDVVFSVACTPTTGAVRVTTSTSGPDADSDGYYLVIDGYCYYYYYYYYYCPFIGSNDTITLSPLSIGDHTLELTSISANCSVNGTNPRSVSVVGGDTVDVVFEVVCSALGSLQITAVTTGMDLDPNGYLAFGSSVPTNGSATISGLVPGDYTVTLSEVAANCDVTSSNPQTASVPSGGTAELTFNVSCAAASLVAYTGFGDGNAEIYVIKSNGTDATRLTMNTMVDVEPAWSLDGSKIAFRSERDGNPEIYVMNADGSGSLRLTNHAARDYEPVWSPDGTKIAFVSERDGNAEIYVMNSDGTGLVRITNDVAYDAQPDWSPDGSRIAFLRGVCDYYGCYGNIHVMNPDGSGLTQLTSGSLGDAQPAWSPDGARLAFARFANCYYYYCERDIFVMDAGGSNVQGWTSGADDHFDPAWSPDGTKIALVSAPCDYYYGCSPFSIKVARGDAAGTVQLTGVGTTQPAWRR